MVASTESVHSVKVPPPNEFPARSRKQYDVSEVRSLTTALVALAPAEAT